MSSLIESSIYFKNEKGEMMLLGHIEEFDLTVDSEMDDIVKKICDFRCSGCKTLLDKLPAKYREAIGED